MDTLAETTKLHVKGYDMADSETKRKFREALERKKQKGQPTSDHKDATSKAAGQHGPESGQQNFRRKTG